MGKYIHKFATVSEYNQAKAAVPVSDPWVSYLEPYGLLTYSSAVNIQEAANGHEYVDLGLPSGTLWATCNVGASVPAGVGDYFAWGETSTKSNYAWSTYAHGSSETNLTKYNASDGRTVLDLEDDVVNFTMGGAWRMPTLEDFDELKNNTTMTMASSGRTFTGSNGNSITIISYNRYQGNSTTGSTGYLWLSTLSDSNPKFACCVCIPSNSTSCYRTGLVRYYGMNVRGVLSPSRRWHNPLLL